MKKETLPNLSNKEAVILELLIRVARPQYGKQLVDTSDGQLGLGMVYVTLDRMEQKGFVTSKPEAAPAFVGGLPRPMYSPTGLGQRALDRWKAAQSFWKEGLTNVPV